MPIGFGSNPQLFILISGMSDKHGPGAAHDTNTGLVSFGLSTVRSNGCSAEYILRTPSMYLILCFLYSVPYRSGSIYS